MPVAPQVYRCERVRQINGSVEFFFTRRDGQLSEQHVIYNVLGNPGDYEVGKLYLVPMPSPLEIPDVARP